MNESLISLSKVYKKCIVYLNPLAHTISKIYIKHDAKRCRAFFLSQISV